MFFAAIGDIAGNFDALNAVLDAIEEEDIHTVVHTGNSVYGVEKQAEIPALLRARNVLCVQGERDRLIAQFYRKETRLRKQLDAEDFHRIQETRGTLGVKDIEWLAGLPPRRMLPLEGLRVLLTHGAPSNPRRLLSADTPHHTFQRERETEPCDVIVSGAAAAFQYRADNTFFIGTGPLFRETGHAVWTLVDTESPPWQAREMRVLF
jgi:predicted phosphodiesterase